MRMKLKTKNLLLQIELILLLLYIFRAVYFLFIYFRTTLYFFFPILVLWGAITYLLNVKSNPFLQKFAFSIIIILELGSVFLNNYYLRFSMIPQSTFLSSSIISGILTIFIIFMFIVEQKMNTNQKAINENN